MDGSLQADGIKFAGRHASKFMGWVNKAMVRTTEYSNNKLQIA
tara:strand:- start:4037 stop:4165 length:129 start_codon:yes stop_codon:yes gene_type:complete